MFANPWNGKIVMNIICTEKQTKLERKVLKKKGTNKLTNGEITMQRKFL